MIRALLGRFRKPAPAAPLPAPPTASEVLDALMDAKRKEEQEIAADNLYMTQVTSVVLPWFVEHGEQLATLNIVVTFGPDQVKATRQFRTHRLNFYSRYATCAQPGESAQCLKHFEWKAMRGAGKSPLVAANEIITCLLSHFV